MNLPGISDDLFIRDKVPMTKEEIRILTMCKAKIRPDSIIWDIGAGTGSLSIEAAMLAPQGRVYAVEKKDLAVELLQKNIAKFALQDKIEVIQANAPQGLENLPDCDVVLSAAAAVICLPFWMKLIQNCKQAAELSSMP